MNRKQLTILLVAGILIGGLGWLLTKRQSQSWSGGQQSGKMILDGLDINQVAQFVVKQNGGEMAIVQQDDGWKVRERFNYPASFNDISDFLRKVVTLKVVQTEEVGPSQLGRLNLIEPGKGKDAGTLLEFRDKSGKAIKTLLLGKKHLRASESPSPFGGEDGFPDGRYIMTPGQSGVALISDPLSNMELRPEQWLNKDFFKVEKPKFVSVTSTNAANSWQMSRDTENGEWKLGNLTGEEKMDPTKAGALNMLLTAPNFADVVGPAGSTNQNAVEEATTATILTFDGFAYTIKFAKVVSNDENYQLNLTLAANFDKERTPGKDEKPEEKPRFDKEFADKLQKLNDKFKQEKAFEKWTYVIPKWSLDALLKERKDYLQVKQEEPPKLEEPKPGEPAAADAKPDAAPNPTSIFGLGDVLQTQPPPKVDPPKEAEKKP